MNPINPSSFQRLVTTVQELSIAIDLDTVMKIVRRVAREITGADGATFVLRDRLEDQEYCYYADEDAIAPLWKGKRFPLRTCISGWAMIHKTPAVIEDIYQDERIPVEAYQPTFVKSLVMVPIRTIDPIGAIGNYWAKQRRPSPEEISLLQSLADITAVTMENIQVYAELEERVRIRTAQLQEKNREITDSINYARRIQKAMLPPKEVLGNYFKDFFIIYKPKDIVAGDFYWFEHKQDLLFIAVADCTGHGVPGAMLSVVCCNVLYRCVNEFGLTQTGEILDKASELVLEVFARGGREINDGMDISLCAIDFKTKQVQWSGANNDLWYIQEGTLRELKAHKQPIGLSERRTSFPSHTLGLKAGDLIYLTTDGFADQFGGENGKKFMKKNFLKLLEGIHENSLSEQAGILEKTFSQWRGSLEQVDDVTVTGIRL
jgi:serine phosphatase RsbU (regulator of sigma subunit)